MTAGFCDDTLNIDTILSGGVRTERIVIARQIVEVKTLGKDTDGTTDVCFRHIEERLKTNVDRGDKTGKIKFKHLRSGLDETFPKEVCK